MNTAIVKANIDPEIKKQAEDILNTIGLTTSRAIALLFHQIVLQQGLPMNLFIPNKETYAANEDAKIGRNITSSVCIKDFFSTLKESKCPSTKQSTGQSNLKTTTAESSGQASL